MLNEDENEVSEDEDVQAAQNNNGVTGEDYSLDVEKVKAAQRKKHYGFENPIVENDAYTPSEDDKSVQDAPMSTEPKIDTNLPEVNGNKTEQDLSEELPVKEGKKRLAPKQPHKTLPWETEPKKE